MDGDGGSCIGIGLASSPWAEHEFGTGTLNMLFGLNGELDGLPRRTMTVLPKGLNLIEFKTRAEKRMKRPSVKGLALIFSEPHFRAEPKDELKEELNYYGESKMAAAWDEKSFGITAYTEEDKAKLRALWDAFHRNDVAFWINIGVFHSGTGLTFAIPSLVPQRLKDEMLENDLDIARLKQSAEATGVTELLKTAGKRWMALSPKWAKELKDVGKGKITTAYDVMYWLNPWNGDKDNYGWFTVEDLQLWAKNEGPVPKHG